MRYSNRFHIQYLVPGRHGTRGSSKETGFYGEKAVLAWRRFKMQIHTKPRCDIQIGFIFNIWFRGDTAPRGAPRRLDFIENKWYWHVGGLGCRFTQNLDAIFKSVFIVKYLVWKRRPQGEIQGEWTIWRVDGSVVEAQCAI